MKSTLLGLILLLSAGVASAALAAEGVWLTEGGKSHVEIRPWRRQAVAAGSHGWRSRPTRTGLRSSTSTTRMNPCAPGRSSGSSC